MTRAAVLDLGDATLSAGNAHRVIEVQKPSNLTYTFSLQNGAVVNGSTPGASGAGLFKATGGPWQAVTIQVFNVHFADNHAIAAAHDDGGGAIHVVGARPICNGHRHVPSRASRKSRLRRERNLPAPVSPIQQQTVAQP
ncbi:MAG: hypothetical protein ABIW82_01595 [Dokdonella sp.]